MGPLPTYYYTQFAGNSLWSRKIIKLAHGQIDGYEFSNYDQTIQLSHQSVNPERTDVLNWHVLQATNEDLIVLRHKQTQRSPFPVEYVDSRQHVPRLFPPIALYASTLESPTGNFWAAGDTLIWTVSGPRGRCFCGARGWNGQTWEVEPLTLLSATSFTRFPRKWVVSANGQSILCIQPQLNPNQGNGQRHTHLKVEGLYWPRGSPKSYPYGLALYTGALDRFVLSNHLSQYFIAPLQDNVFCVAALLRSPVELVPELRVWRIQLRPSCHFDPNNPLPARIYPDPDDPRPYQHIVFDDTPHVHSHTWFLSIPKGHIIGSHSIDLRIAPSGKIIMAIKVVHGDAGRLLCFEVPAFRDVIAQYSFKDGQKTFRLLSGRHLHTVESPDDMLTSRDFVTVREKYHKHFMQERACQERPGHIMMKIVDQAGRAFIEAPSQPRPVVAPPAPLVPSASTNSEMGGSSSCGLRGAFVTGDTPSSKRPRR